MAKIVDPDSLNQATEVVLSTAAKTIQLLVAGTLDDTAPSKTSGVTGQALYSFLKEEWNTDNALNKFRFPMQMIYEASFILINGWTFADQTSIDLLRDAGFQYTNGAGDLVEDACVLTLGDFNNVADQGYYQKVTGVATTTVFNQTVTNFHNTGEVNENIEVFDAGATDFRGYLKVFLREQGKSFASYSLLSQQGLSALTYAAYRLPLSNDTDLKIVDSDATVVSGVGVTSGVTYNELSVDYLVGNLFVNIENRTWAVGDVVLDGDTTPRWAICTGGGTTTATGAYASFAGTSTWAAYAGERQIGANFYAFNRIIDATDVTGGVTSARIAEIHTWAQWSLRQTTDINANTNGDAFGTVNGNIAVDLTGFVGDTMTTNAGVYIDGFDVNDQNSIEFYDITVGAFGAATTGLDAEWIPVTTSKRTFPFVAAGSFNFSQNFVDELDATTRYVAYFAYHETVTDATIGITPTTGNIATIIWTGTILDNYLVGDSFIATGHTNTVNNGLWVVTTVGANTMTATKQNVAPTTEAAGASVTYELNPFDSDDATIVNNDGGSPLDGQIASSAVVWDYDFDGNEQRGVNTKNTLVPIIIVAIADDGAQWISSTHTITRTTGQNVAVNATDELNYST